MGVPVVRWSACTHMRGGSASQRNARLPPQATGSPVEGLPGDAAEAMRAPLPPMSSSGSWSAACGNCTGGAAALAALPAGAQLAFWQRCLDCGFGAGAAVRAGAHS